MLAYADALELLLRQRFAWGTECVPLARAAGRVLARPVIADRDFPPFDRVAMDGVAIDHRASARGLRRFRVAGVQAAGEAPRRLPGDGACLEVMTGASLPLGASSVVRYERLSRAGAVVTVSGEVGEGSDVHPRGADARAGAELAAAGRCIGLAEVGLLATCGYAEVEVRRRPRTAIVATGTELVPVGAAVESHQIRSSNAVQLAYLLAGVSPASYLLADDRAVLRQRTGELLAAHDLIVVSGGVSRGRYDFVAEVLAELGVERLFHGVAQRPGKPLWVGRTATTLVVGLPGNPLAAVACAVAYLGPWLERQLGLDSSPRQVRLAESVPARGSLTLLQSVTLEERGGDAVVRPVRHGGSGDLASLVHATGLLVLPGERPGGYPVGEAFPYLPFEPLI